MTARKVPSGTITLVIAGAESDLQSAVDELTEFDQIPIEIISQGKGAWLIEVPKGEQKTVERVAADYHLTAERV
jgi:hypothetical protein